MLKNATLLIEEYLGEDKSIIDIQTCIITETDHPDTHLQVEYTFSKSHHSNPNPIQSYGDGFVDALVKGLVGRFKEDYKSLNNISLSRYEVSARIKTMKGMQSDASVVVELGIKTPSSQEILFKEQDQSVVRASTKIVRNAIQFMINCEEAVYVIHKCLQYAKERNRLDMIEKYTRDLVELVKITSYEEILKEK